MKNRLCRAKTAEVVPVIIMAILALLLLGGCAGTTAGKDDVVRIDSEPMPPPSSPPAPKPAPPPAPFIESPAPIPKPAAEKITLTSNVFFSFNDFRLSPGERQLLTSDFEQKLKGVRPELIIITGHADKWEKEPMTLATRRAEEVKRQFVARGIDPNLIFVTGKGNTQPEANCASSLPTAQRIACAKPDRRTDVAVVGTGKYGGANWKLETGEIPVLFGTNRSRTGSDDPEEYFGNEEPDPNQSDQLIMGRAVVSVPPTHTEGNVENPIWWRVTVQNLPIEIRKPLGLGGFRARDRRRHFTFSRPIEELNEGQFSDELKKELGAAESREALLYIHGYENTFSDAAFRAAQLAVDLQRQKLDVVPLVFSWPSNPGGISKDSYRAARDRTTAAAEQLQVFLGKIFDITGTGVVHIVAHSMGAEVLATTLRELRAENLMVTKYGHRIPKFNQIILAAPDIRANDFRAAVLPAINSGHHVVNYASSNDLVLRQSKRINKGARAGDSGNNMVRVENVEMIDATNVNSELLGHSFFAESPRMIADLKILMKTGQSPDARGLERVRRNTWEYWHFPCPNAQGC